MSNCPICGTELEKYKDKFICKNCKQVFTKDDLTKAQRPWYKNLCADESLWYKKVFDKYPSIIAHEYWRLYDLLEHGQTYGAFWQLKDLFEVLLKFPTLILASVIYAKQERAEAENKILIALLEKHLSLGDWQRIGGKCKKFSHINNDVVSILKNIVSIYDNDEYQIAKWRNDEIGHGALKFDADYTFQKDIEEKIALLKKHFEDCDLAYSRFQLYLEKNGRRRVLHGKDNARNLTCESSEVLIEIEGFKHTLSPYILLQNHGIYFFDSYYISKDSTAILNYPEGKKHESRGQEIPNNLVSALYKELEITNEAGTLLKDETYSVRAEEVLNKIASVDDFQKPVYIEEWLSTATKSVR